MIVVRCTSKLLAKLAIRPIAEPGCSTSLLGDWYATLLHTRRGKFVLAIARNTLLPIVVTGRDLRAFPQRLAVGVTEVLEEYNVPSDLIEAERVAMADVQYARTDDRSNVGVLTELQRLLHYDLDELPQANIKELSLRLARTPIVARALFPVNATCRLFNVPPKTL